MRTSSATGTAVVDYLEDSGRLRRLHSSEAGRNLVDTTIPSVLGAAVEARGALEEDAGLYDTSVTRTRHNVCSANLRDCSGHSNLTVGDDGRALLFSRCKFQNILDFPKQFAGATTVTIEQNYR